MMGGGGALQLLVMRRCSDDRQRIATRSAGATMAGSAARGAVAAMAGSAAAHGVVAMVGSALQPWPTLRCNVEKQNFCFVFLFFTRELHERKREGEREKGKRALTLALGS